jgi:hypothetical protein
MRVCSSCALPGQSFGIGFAPSRKGKIFDLKMNGVVMGALVHPSTLHYAIIQVSSKKDHPERLVIAYPDEDCLRDLIAAPSIVGLGFRSHKKAVAKLLGSTPAPRCSKLKRPMPVSFKVSCKPRQDADSASRCGFVKNHRTTYHVLQCAFSTIAVLFYSNNLFSLILRTALGCSS